MAGSVPSERNASADTSIEHQEAEERQEALRAVRSATIKSVEADGNSHLHDWEEGSYYVTHSPLVVRGEQAISIDVDSTLLVYRHSWIRRLVSRNRDTELLKEEEETKPPFIQHYSSVTPKTDLTIDIHTYGPSPLFSFTLPDGNITNTIRLYGTENGLTAFPYDRTANIRDTAHPIDTTTLKQVVQVLQNGKPRPAKNRSR